MDKPMKITIEGYQEEPIVLEDIKSITLVVEYFQKSSTSTLVKGSSFFLGFSIAVLLSQLKEGDEPCLTQLS
jgi:hypothetical protein